MRLNDNIKLFYNFLDSSVLLQAKYLFIFLPITFFFAVVGHITYGPYLDIFNSIPLSCLQVMLYFIGDINYTKMFYFAPQFSIFYFTAFFVFQLYFVTTIIVSLLTENLKHTFRIEGYPEDIQTKKWTLKDYVKWICYCVDFGNDDNK